MSINRAEQNWPEETEPAAHTELDAIGIRRYASVLLDHAIARLGKYSDGWMTCDGGDREAVYAISTG